MPRRNFSSTELGRNHTEVLMAAARAPITITKHKQSRYVLMTKEHYDQLTKTDGPRQAFLSKDLPDEMHDELVAGIEEYLGESEPVE
ncbi:type II toxin-antitoxin system prevent-host-death family antitoxin [Nitratireductor sp. XY-223]|uniref:type II toxin-antitoxin system prevent-host-death family antitoxin n=1 Tax=Nitratireductor sp. XY-223 TaxID=2561926 RepID=UPI0010A9BA46|nr:type II toxin-antitoxin system prevent-host-death family antitoxin [Nitratireductor sp. XY-223]